MAAASDASASASSADKTAAASTAGALKDDGESPCLRMDVHTHILPRTWPDLKARYGYGGFIKLDHHHKCSARMLRDDGTFFREVGARTWDLDARIAESNRIAMNVQVLSTVPVMFSYWAKPDHALDLSKMLNDHMASCVAANPTRFVGLGTIPLQDPDLACDELKRCVNELGLRGVEIGTHVNDWTLSEPELFKVFKTAEELGASIFIHPWDMVGTDLMRKYWLPWLVGMPAESSLALCSLIFGGVFERLRDLKVCVAHGGGSFPATVGRIAHGYHVRPDLCAVDCAAPPTDFLGRFWSDSLVHDPAALNNIVSLFGEDKVCCGSDYPFPLGEMTNAGKDYAAGSLIDSMTGDAWTPQRKAKLHGLNACEWLGVEASTFWA